MRLLLLLLLSLLPLYNNIMIYISARSRRLDLTRAAPARYLHTHNYLCIYIYIFVAKDCRLHRAERCRNLQPKYLANLRPLPPRINTEYPPGGHSSVTPLKLKVSLSNAFTRIDSGVMWSVTATGAVCINPVRVVNAENGVIQWRIILQYTYGVITDNPNYWI